MTEKRTYGLVDDGLRVRDWRFGGVSASRLGSKLESGNWFSFMGQMEYQYSKRGDTYACVSFSATNCVEILINRMIRNGELKKDMNAYKFLNKNGYLRLSTVNGQQEVNFSDRHLAKMSDTKRWGNTFRHVGNTVRKFGLVPEESWPFTDYMAWDEYYKTIPNELIELGKQFLYYFPTTFEFVSNSRVSAALKRGPLQVGIYMATKQDALGVYQNRTKNANHAVTLFSQDGGVNNIFDHYPSKTKELVNDYNWGGVVLYSVTINNKNTNMPALKIANNTLVQEVEESGQAGLMLDGKIGVGDLAKVHFTWDMRNNGDTAGKVRTLTKKEWSQFEQFDLKGNKV